MTRYLCIDLGDKRTGIAVGDTILHIASPVAVLEVPIDQRNGDALLDAIAKSCEEQLGVPPAVRGGERSGSTTASRDIVIGLPLNMDGTEGSRAKLVRAFAQRIEGRTGRGVLFRDERLSSVAADWTMARSGLTHKQKKARRDALAAAGILQSFLNEQRGPAEAGPRDELE